MSWFSRLLGKKKEKQPEVPQETARQILPVKTEHIITLGDEAMHVFSTLRKLLHPAQRGGVSQEHMKEFEKLDEAYKDHVRSNAKPGYFPEITIEVSQGFYDTWFWRLFNDFFSSHGINKSDARIMDNLYKKLNEGEDHPEFLKRYNSYYDR